MRSATSVDCRDTLPNCDASQEETGNPEIQGPQLDLIALDGALEELAARDSRSAALVKLRFFAGLAVLLAQYICMLRRSLTFGEVSAVSSLPPTAVIPGHGPPISVYGGITAGTDRQFSTSGVWFTLSRSRKCSQPASRRVAVARHMSDVTHILSQDRVRRSRSLRAVAAAGLRRIAETGGRKVRQ